MDRWPLGSDGFIDPQGDVSSSYSRSLEARRGEYEEAYGDKAANKDKYLHVQR